MWVTLPMSKMDESFRCSYFLVLLLLTTSTAIMGNSDKSEFPEALSSPAETTSCSNMVDGKVDCSHRGLTAVPKNIPTTVRILDLSHNKLSTVTPDAFDGLKKLQILSLSYNTISRKSIVMELFKDLANLEELYLNHNQVNKFYENVFTNLGNLKILDLSDMNNGIVKPIPREVFAPLKSLTDLRLNNDLLPSFNFLPEGALPKLQKLELARNGISIIAEGDFKYLEGTSIDNLDLSGNDLTSIDPSCFSGLKLLNFINLKQAIHSEDAIAQVGTALKEVHVTNMSLSMIGLTNLTDDTFNTFGGVPLEALDLSLNNISHIAGAPFQYLTQLGEINLYKNFISNIGPDAFSHLGNLRTLDLSNNSLTKLNETTFQSLTESVLRVLYLEINRIETIEAGTFHGLGQLEFLKLSRNRLTQTILGPELEGMPKLKILDLGLNKDISIGEDAFANVTSLTKLYLNVIGLKTMMAGKSPFRHLVNLEMLDLSNNSLSRILAPDSFKSLTKLQVLYLQHNNLYHLWEDSQTPVDFLTGLTSLRKADLSYNGFHKIPDGAFKNTTHLQILLLARNQIANLTSSSFEGLSSLRELQLHHNNLNVIKETSFHPFLESLQSLSIKENPWLCNCELEWFRKWIDKTDVNITDLGKTTCADPRGTSLLDFWPSPYVCDGKLRPMYYYIIGGSVLSALLLVLLLWCCRWRIRYCLLRGRARQRYRRRDGYRILPGRDSAYESDVFISYSSLDKGWVEGILRPQLDGTGADQERFHINIHDETFVAGESIIENITGAIDTSRKTLCIISRNYLASNWCKYEHDVAMFKHFGDRKCLILIRLDDVNNSELKQHDLIYQVTQQDTYLKWPGERASSIEKKVFWEKLKEAVAKREAPRCGSGCCCCCCCC